MCQAVTAQVEVLQEGGIYTAKVSVDRSHRYTAHSMYGQDHQEFVDQVLDMVQADFNPAQASVVSKA